MRIELLNQSKYRHGSRPGDDVPLVIPGVVFGVFDGATDARGTVVDGIAAGRLAALTVSAEMAAIAAQPDRRHLPGDALIARLSEALVSRAGARDLPIPPSTTVAVVLDCGADWRFLLLGDSGVRLNGTEVLRREKLIDRVSTLARVMLFEHFSERQDDPDAVEQAARRGILLGLDLAVAEGVLDAAGADAIIEAVIVGIGLQEEGDTVAEFLRGGIQTQHRFGNATGSRLCFDTMNGTRPLLGELIDTTRPKAAVDSIEIFSDGYPDLPGAVSAAAWEHAFHEAERTDFHKTGPFATVKGSTSAEFFDDRTVLVLSDMLA
jgi:hypothetical protein